MLILALSWGLSLSQNAPKITPSRPQNTLIVTALIILKLMTRSIGACIVSGLGGIPRYAMAIIAAYAAGIIIIFFACQAPLFLYINASPSALNPDIARKTMYRICL